MDRKSGITVKHSADKMKAFVSLSKDSGPFNAGMILTELLHGGVVHGLNTAIIHRFVSVGLFDKYVEVAQGTLPTPGADGRVEIIAAGAGGGVPGEIVVVSAGEAVARKVPPRQGVNGMDVFGGALPAPAVKEPPLRIGEGIVVSADDPCLLISERGGSFRHDAEGLLEVRPFQDIAGDVGGAGGNVFFTGDLRIGGTVKSDGAVDASGAVVIMGGVEDAAVKCGGDLVVRGAVSGGEKSMIDCGGSFRAGKFERAVLNAGGGVTVAGDIIDAEINCRGVLKAGGIAGGSAVADGGVTAKTAGNASGAPTVIDVSAAHSCVKRQEAIRNSVNIQKLLTEGCVSELYCFVRDNMDEFGEIPEFALLNMDDLINSLKESVAVKDDLLYELAELDERLKELAGCGIAIDEAYPGVHLKLGFTEQRVTSLMKDVRICHPVT